jgi:phosphatidyl-myo-inositol alpha-mannosyltransferase
MRVALVFDDTVDRPGGVSHYIQALAAELRDAGHDVALLVGESATDRLGDVPVHSLARNLPVRFNGSAGSMPLPARARRLTAVLRNGAFDVVHVQVPFSPLLAGRLIRRLPSDVALVGTYHVASSGVLAATGARVLGLASRRALRRFDAMMAVSETAASSASRFGVPGYEVVPSLLDVNAFAGVAAVGRAGAPNTPLRVVHLGALTQRKGANTFVDAVRVLSERGLAVDAVIAGVGPQQAHLKRRAQGLPVRFLGAVSHFEKAELLGSADVACFPADRGESLGVVLLEAMAAGTPVVAGNTGGYVETLAGSGVVCPPTAHGVAVAVEGLLRNPARRKALAERGRERVLRYDAAAVTASVLDVYRRALAQRRGINHVAAHTHA